MKKYVLIILGILAGAFLAIYIISCIPRQINLEYPAVEYDVNNKDYERLTSVLIQGKFYKRLFSTPVYKGKLSTGGYEISENYELIPLAFLGGELKNQGYIHYTTVVDAKPELKFFGTLFMSDNFKNINIEINDEFNKQPGRKLSIAAPARTRKEAVEIAQALHR